jgi:hypothetical protein
MDVSDGGWALAGEQGEGGVRVIVGEVGGGGQGHGGGARVD